MVTIREALSSELAEVLHVEKLAFNQEDEAELVRLLLADPSARPVLSLLALIDAQAVGHILFSKASILGTPETLSATLLAPLAVIPKAQNQGIGSQLIEYGFQQLSATGVSLVFVLGYPQYYSRFGFAPAGALGFEAPYPIPDKHADAWMVRSLQPDVIGTVSGKVVCANAISKPEYWLE